MKNLQERLAKFSGGVTVIQVGSATKIERKKLWIEDALVAIKASVEEGIVAGGLNGLYLRYERYWVIMGTMWELVPRSFSKRLKNLSYELLLTQMLADIPGETSAVPVMNPEMGGMY